MRPHMFIEVSDWLVYNLENLHYRKITQENWDYQEPKKKKIAEWLFW